MYPSKYSIFGVSTGWTSPFWSSFNSLVFNSASLNLLDLLS
ncbi:hypothetical protein V2P57_02040 [Mycoplasma mycoides subsp. mycoides]|nr:MULTISPECIES: hypothetical protein [Mycoplasma mycoides group]